MEIIIAFEKKSIKYIDIRENYHWIGRIIPLESKEYVNEYTWIRKNVRRIWDYTHGIFLESL